MQHERRDPGSDWPPAEYVAALVNGSIVVLVPMALLLVSIRSNMNAPVRPPEYSGFFMDLTRALMSVVPLAPFSLIAAWRTWAHARAWLAGRGTGWQGVIEGGALGLFIALAILIRPSLEHPRQAPPYLIAYGGGAFVIGLTIGFILRFTALLTLGFLSWQRAGRSTS
jgi:hypothetical protein